MIYTVSGKVIAKKEGFIVVEVGASLGGVGLKINSNKSTIDSFKLGDKASFFTFLYVRETDLELFGFEDEKTLKLFEMLTSVSGIGPKTALGVLDTDETNKIIAAIVEKRPDFLTKASGIGKKTAERVILELHSKLSLPGAGSITEAMDTDSDVEEALVGLGYKRHHVKQAISKLGQEPKDLEGRLKEALKNLS
ncbi:MAG: Holliday junction branch migration protein RuvA [Candidatus Paceibacterota bacterium]